MSFEPIISGFMSFFYFIVVLGLAVIFHEWGHFIIAKLCGAKVERFAVGFGKVLFSTQRGETEYALCALPLGGYVKITGMDPEDETTGAEWEYLQLSPWKRMAIVIAGPLMNFVLAFLIYFIIYAWFGVAYTASTTVGYVPKGSWGWEMGLRDGDKIVAVNGEAVKSWDDVVSLQSDMSQSELKIRVERNGETLVKTKAIPTGLYERSGDEAPEPPAHDKGIVIASVLSDRAADTAGLEPGWVILSADGQNFQTRDEWSDYFNSRFEKTDNGEFRALPVTLKVLTLDGREKEVQVTPDLVIPSDDAVPAEPVTRIGITFQGEMSVKEYMLPIVPPLGVAPKQTPVIGNVQEGGPAWEAGLRPDCTIVEIDGKAIDDWTDVLLAIQDSLQTGEDGTVTARPLEMTWMDSKETMHTESIEPSVKMQPLLTPTSIKTGKEYAIAQIGVDRKADRQRMGVLGAISEGWNHLVNISSFMLNFIFDLFSGAVSPKLLGGPIAIYQLSGESGRWGMEKFLGFIAMLSANLGLLNLFPLPPLDGGHLVFYLYEVFRRKPITMRQMEKFGQVGFFLIVPLMLYLVFNDLNRVNFFGWVAGLFGL
ncbi:MAG: RIP metalloprotease RseP [bacterium]|nr:RIP metalloprotease RseP [bacterium]